MSRTYAIAFPAICWECTVEIDEEFVLDEKGATTKDAIKQMVEFWTDWEDCLELNDGDYTTTFLQQLARVALFDQIGENHNLHGVISYFNNAEGWCKMDGSAGVKITYIEDVDIADRDFEVERKVTNG